MVCVNFKIIPTNALTLDQYFVFLKNVNDELFGKVLEDLVSYIQKLPVETKPNETVLPCQILLTGTNLPDHRSLLSTLSKNIKEKVSPHIATLWSRDSSSIKNAISSIVRQLIEEENESDEVNDEVIITLLIMSALDFLC